MSAVPTLSVQPLPKRGSPGTPGGFRRQVRTASAAAVARSALPRGARGGGGST